MLRIPPDEGISLQFEVKRRGPVVDLAAVKMDFRYDDWFPKEPNVGYETLIYDVMIGDPTLFMRADMVEEAWRVVQPVLDAWAAKKADFPDYDSGSDGPEAADELLARDKRDWRPVNRPVEREAVSGRRDIRLLLADVDGTLVTQDKVLTRSGAGGGARSPPRRHRACHHQRPAAPRHEHADRAAGAGDRAIAGFNGGVLVNPDLTVIEQHALDPAAAKQALALILDRKLDAWVYTESEWLIRDPRAPHVAREAWTVKFDAKVVPSFTDAHLARAVKIVGISDDLDARRRLRKGGAGDARRPGERGALAALLSRRHSSPGQQGRGRHLSLPAS